MKWLRLYHDTITDPKWRLVAVESGQPEATVLGVWMAMLVNASDSPERGSLHDWNDRVMGAALGIGGEAVSMIRRAMQGVVLDGDRLTGWDKRQRASDNVAARVKKHRSSSGGGSSPGNGGGGARNGTVTEHTENVTLHQADVTLQKRKNGPRNVTETLPPLESDSVVTSKTPKNPAADAGARPPHVEVGERVAEMAGLAGSPNWFGDYGRVAAWLKEGYDAEMDIYPTVARLMHRRHGVPPSGLKYFETAIAEHYAARTAPLPVAEVHVLQPRMAAGGRPVAMTSDDKAAYDLLVGLGLRDAVQ